MSKIQEAFITSGKFLAAQGCLENSEVILFGVPFDGTVSFRPGSRFGPAAIRQVSPGIEEYSVYSDKDLRAFTFTDLGDLELPLGNTEKCMNVIYHTARKLFSHYSRRGASDYLAGGSCGGGKISRFGRPSFRRSCGSSRRVSGRKIFSCLRHQIMYGNTG